MEIYHAWRQRPSQHLHIFSLETDLSLSLTFISASEGCGETTVQNAFKSFTTNDSTSRLLPPFGSLSLSRKTVIMTAPSPKRKRPIPENFGVNAVCE